MTCQKGFFSWFTLICSKNLKKLKMSHTDVIEKIKIEKLWFSFKNWFICFFPHELTCMWSYHLLLKFLPIKHTVFFTKRQCVTSSEIWITGQTKHRGLGGGPVCFFERDAIFLECSKANFDEFWKIFNIKFWCHTLTHSIVLRRLPLCHRKKGRRGKVTHT